MIDEHQLLRDAGKSAQAQQLLDNPLFNEALLKIETDLITAWRSTPARDQEGRERCWNALQQAGKIKGYFEAVLNDGKLAAAQLKELAAKR